MTTDTQVAGGGMCAKQSLYAELPDGKVVPCNWVQYEQLKAFGWVHRILTENQAVLHNIRKGKK